jgi:hypothetical protein
LALLAFHTLVTGSPTPLWQIERLHNPVAVKEVVADGLLLTDGQQVRLPLITTLPQSNPLFTAAIREGVEVRDDGQVMGLLWVDRSCGNDPYVWCKYRINLSELAAALNPAGIDSSIVHPEAIALLAENYRIEPRPSRPNRLNGYQASRLWQFRRQFEWSLEQMEQSQQPKPNPSYSIPLYNGQ